MKRFSLIVILMFLSVPTVHSQIDVMSYRANRIAPFFIDGLYSSPRIDSDSVIHQFESYYGNASSNDRARFEQFVRLIPMVNRVKEIQTIIDLFGKDFYRISLDEFMHLEDRYINSWFKKMPEDHSFWIPKFEKPHVRNNSELTNVSYNPWGNSRSSFAFGFRPNNIEFPESSSRDLSDASKRTFNLFKKYRERKKFFPRDSLLNNFQKIESIEHKYDMILMFLQNMLAYKYWGDFESAVKEISDQIINDSRLSNSLKIKHLLSINRLIVGYRPHFFMEELLTNYAWIRTILENPNTYPDRELTPEKRGSKLQRLDYIEAQTLLTLSEYFPEHDLFLQESWKILINYCEYDSDYLIDYLLLSEFKTKNLEYSNRMKVNEVFYPKETQIRKISEKWSLIQAMSRLGELLEDKPEFGEYLYLMNRFYKSAIIHFRLNDNLDQVRVVIQNAFANLHVNNSFLENYIHYVPEIYRRSGNVSESKWWKNQLKYLKKHYPDSNYFLPPEGTIAKLINFHSLSESEKQYFLSRDFLKELERFLKMEQFELGFHFDNQSSSLSVGALYCARRGAYKHAYYLSRLVDRMSSWGGAGEHIIHLFKRRSQIIDREKIQSKSAENKSLKDYQKELKELNNDLNSTNTILVISLIITVILVVISVYLYLRTRRIKDRLTLETKRLEATSLSIGQIGHLAKNMVSEIYNSYFKTPTQYELDVGRKALKRLRNIFQTFEDNHSRITQSIDQEINFAADFVLIQNRDFSEEKTKQDILDRIINHQTEFHRSKIDVPIYTVVNIIDNAFKHSILEDDIQIDIRWVFPSFMEGKDDVEKIKIICKAKTPEGVQKRVGKGSKYIREMLRNYSDLPKVGYRNEINSDGHFQHILILPKSEQRKHY